MNLGRTQRRSRHLLDGRAGVGCLTAAAAPLSRSPAVCASRLALVPASLASACLGGLFQ